MREPFADHVERAIGELSRKNLRQIQRETAKVWYGRAIAAARLFHEDASEYAHEAIEHAALAGDDGLLWEIREGLRLNGVPV